jgi:hypothetical protein
MLQRNKEICGICTHFDDSQGLKVPEGAATLFDALGKCMLHNTDTSVGDWCDEGEEE